MGYEPGYMAIATGLMQTAKISANHLNPPLSGGL